MHAESLEEKAITRIVLECHAALGIGHSHPALIIADNESGQLQVTVPAPSSLIQDCTIASGFSFSIKVHWLPGSGGDGDTHITPHVLIEAISDNPLSLNQCRQFIARMRIAVRFASCSPAHFQVVELWAKDVALPCGILSLTREKVQSPRDFSYYSLHKGSISSIELAMQNIMTCNEDLLAMIGHFQRAVDFLGDDLEKRFFDLARILERLLGRLWNDDRIIPAAEHKSHVAGMLIAIASTPKEYLERIENILQNANSYSPRNKLDRFMRTDSQAHQIVPHGDNRKAFIGRFVGARNSIAHFVASKDDHVTWNDIEVAIRLGDLCIWRLLGVEGIPLSERYGQWALVESPEIK